MQTPNSKANKTPNQKQIKTPIRVEFLLRFKTTLLILQFQILPEATIFLANDKLLP